MTKQREKELIVNPAFALQALRNSGYNTATAIAELVDNAIEAEAKDIEIITLSRKRAVGRRTVVGVHQVGILDNGTGMSEDVLDKCLCLGFGTRLDSWHKTEGLGKFGFGLKGSSISQGKRVEVYSWSQETKGKIFKVKLDLDQIIKEEKQYFDPCTEAQLPKEIQKHLGDKIGETGTLVMWSELDKIDNARSETLRAKLNTSLCRIYRHFLDDDDRYGKKRNICFYPIDLDEDRLEEIIPLKANDPLYLLTPNNLPGYKEKATNYQTESFEVPITYLNKDGREDKSNLLITVSMAEPGIQKLTGNSEQGRHYEKNTGISFVRAGREIQLSEFGFLTRSEPRNRWWGIEVRFSPLLDELFRLTADKQKILGIKCVDKREANISDDLFADQDYESLLNLELNKIINEKIKDCMKIINSRGKNSRSGGDDDKVGEYVNKIVKQDKNKTQSDLDNQNKTEDEKKEEVLDSILKGDTSLNEEEAEEIVEKVIDYKVNLTTDAWPGHLFLERRSIGNSSMGIINRETQFYEKFWRYLEGQSDNKGYEALEVLFMAFIRAEDELVRKYDAKMFSDFRNRWGDLVEELIEIAGN